MTVFKKKIFFLFPVLIFLLPSILLAQNQAVKLRVVTEQANIRLKPDIGSIIIQQVPKGTVLESEGKQGDWYRVNIKTDQELVTTGYVHQSLVKVIPSPRKETVKTEEPEEEPPREEPPQIQAPPRLPPSFRMPRHSFDLLLLGGGNYVAGGDLNKGAQGLADFYSDLSSVEGEGEVKPAHLSYIYGGELSFPLTSNFSMGIGLDYFFSQKESQVIFEKAPATDTFTTRPQIRAVPLRIFISFFPLRYFYFKGGMEYYFAKCTYFYRWEREDDWQEWQGEASTQDIGFLAALGLELKLFSPLSLVAEAAGRYARLTGFKGENLLKDSDGVESTEKGRLYFYQGNISGTQAYPLLFIRENKPSEPDVSDVKDAVVDFSGLSLKLGLKIRF
ncbi:MAG: SH3 domain-containing protein [Candidatus Aminicenantes bacterium]